jgi:2-iminobutanoate/2-iminopropanoate deaminase
VTVAIRAVTSGKAWEKAVSYTPAVRVEAGPLLFLSGQVARGADGRLVGRNDLAVQTRQAFRNLCDLLQSGGSSVNHVIKLTYFVTDMSQWPKVAAVRAEFFPSYLPASTTVEVSRLFNPDYLIEIEAVAVIPKDRQATRTRKRRRSI